MTRANLLWAQAEYAVLAQQEASEKKDRGELRYLADDFDCPDIMRLAALTEELGEIARCIHDGNLDNLHTELSQLAGICLAWGAALEQTLLTHHNT